MKCFSFPFMLQGGDMLKTKQVVVKASEKFR